MRIRAAAALVLVMLCCAGPLPNSARAATFTLGSSLGLDVYRWRETSLISFSTAPTSTWLVTAAEPGLRLGLVLPGDDVELAALVELSVLAGEGDALTSAGLGLEGNYCFAGQSDLRPYIGLHAGAKAYGYDGETDSRTQIGAQLGLRRMVSAGHGALRFELRGNLMPGDEYDSMNSLGLRMGYELWFR